MSKLFNLVKSNFTQDDYKQFKTDLYGTYKALFNRSLKPSTLDNFASRILGANNPNVLAATLDTNDLDHDLSLERSVFNAVSSVFFDSTELDMIPLVEINGLLNDFKFSLTVYCEVFVSSDCEVSFRLFLYSDDDPSNFTQTYYSEMLSLGGVYVSDIASTPIGFSDWFFSNGFKNATINSTKCSETLGFSLFSEPAEKFNFIIMSELLSAVQYGIINRISDNWKISYFSNNLNDGNEFYNKFVNFIR